MSRREATVAVPVLRVPLGMQMGGVRLGPRADMVPPDLFYVDQDAERLKDVAAMRELLRNLLLRI